MDPFGETGDRIYVDAGFHLMYDLETCLYVNYDSSFRFTMRYKVRWSGLDMSMVIEMRMGVWGLRWERLGYLIRIVGHR